MCKAQLLQALYSLSDAATEFPRSRTGCRSNAFSGLGWTPGATTVWLFRERLAKARMIDALFARFHAALQERGYLDKGSQIIDATVVPAPRQRNTEAETAAIRDRRLPKGWEAKLAKVILPRFPGHKV